MSVYNIPIFGVGNAFYLSAKAPHAPNPSYLKLGLAQGSPVGAPGWLRLGLARLWRPGPGTWDGTGSACLAWPGCVGVTIIPA